MDMFVWTSGFHSPLAQTHFNMFVDEWTSANESPEDAYHMLQWPLEGGAMYPSMHLAGGVCPGGVCPGGCLARWVSA